MEGVASAGRQAAEASRSDRLPAGVVVRPLDPRVDARGVFTEVFRASWKTEAAPVQWNAVSSRSGVLRGAHVHPRHDDYLILLTGRASIGLRDIRHDSPSQGVVSLVGLRGDRPAALTIPRGVIHGFYFHEPSLHLYSVSEYWDPADELGCHWADPELGIAWPDRAPLLSERDEKAQSFRGLLEELEPFQPIG